MGQKLTVVVAGATGQQGGAVYFMENLYFGRAPGRAGSVHVATRGGRPAGVTRS